MHRVGDGAAGQRDLRLAALGLHAGEHLQQPRRHVGRHAARVVVPDDLRAHFVAAFLRAAGFFRAGLAIPPETSFFAVAA